MLWLLSTILLSAKERGHGRIRLSPCRVMSGRGATDHTHTEDCRLTQAQAVSLPRRIRRSKEAPCAVRAVGLRIPKGRSFVTSAGHRSCGSARVVASRCAPPPSSVRMWYDPGSQGNARQPRAAAKGTTMQGQATRPTARLHDGKTSARLHPKPSGVSSR